MQAAMQPPPYMPYGPGLPPGGTPVPVAMVASVMPQHETGFTQRQRKTMTVLSGLQIAIGISCAIIYIVLISVHRVLEYLAYLDSVGAGIWCGGLYIIAGGLGVAAALLNRLGLMISSMVFSILSSLILWVVIGFAAVAISIDHDMNRPCDDTLSDYSYRRYSCAIYGYIGYQVADSMLIIFSVIELVISIWCSVLCCKGACKTCCLDCCYDSRYGYQAPMIYTPVNSAGQQVILIQQSGVAGGQAMNVLPNQPFYVDMQIAAQARGQAMNVFPNPTHYVDMPAAAQAAAAAARPGYQPGVTWLPEYPGTHAGNFHGSSADDSPSGEVTKDEPAYGH